jgi:hypothetical protein
VALAASALLALGGCGGAEDGTMVARVGASIITQRALHERMSSIAPEHLVPDPPRYTACISHEQSVLLETSGSELEEECQRQYTSLQQRALSSLIGWRWLVGEAEEEHLGLHGSLASAAEQAEAALRERLAKQLAPVTQAEVVASYRRNIRRYEHPERRYIDIVERLPSAAAARSALAELASGRNVGEMSIHEVFDRRSLADPQPWKRAILADIFSARPGVLVGPRRLNGFYCVFKVTGVTPRRLEPLAAAQTAIKRQLAEEHERVALARFIAAWRKKWLVRTSCRAGYVVQRCRQYQGPRTPEDPLRFN